MVMNLLKCGTARKEREKKKEATKQNLEIVGAHFKCIYSIHIPVFIFLLLFHSVFIDLKFKYIKYKLQHMFVYDITQFYYQTFLPTTNHKE